MYIKSRYQWIKLLLITLFFFQVGVACTPEVETRKQVHTDIKAVMEKRKLAIESKDIEAYKKLFLREYQDGGVDYSAIVADMEHYFASTENIEFIYVKNPMNFTMNTARMVSMVSYQTEKMEKPVYHHERTLFRRIDGQWFISGGVAIDLF